MRLVLWFDGSCEPKNPGGVATAGWVIRVGDRSGEKLTEGSALVCQGAGATNNVAEWAALEAGLIAALDQIVAAGELPSGELVIHGDSQLVVNQLSGFWACRAPHLRERRDRCEGLVSEIEHRRFACAASWVPRSQNAEADRLSRRAYEEVRACA